MRERGAIVPVVALALTVVIGFAALALDVGFWRYVQRQQQTAADAAALGGAQQLIYDGCGNSSAATTAAQNDSASNGFTNGRNVIVTVANPPASGPYSGNTCAVDVKVSGTTAPAYLTSLFGFKGGVKETTEAVGQVLADGNGCIYLLSSGSQSIFNGDTFNSPDCGLYINDTATFNGDPKFAAPFIGYARSAPVENGTDFTLATPSPMVPVSDPCPEITGCNYWAKNPPSTSGCTSATFNGESTANVSPGCYNSIIINGCANVVFAAGTYVFNGTTIINGETSVTGSGVTFYVTANGQPPTFNGISSLSLAPPSTGNGAGVLYYQVPSNTQSPIFNGTSMSISGLIYAPGATSAVFNGTQGQYVVLVVGAATFNGSSAYDIASPPPNGSLIKTSVLGL